MTIAIHRRSRKTTHDDVDWVKSRHHHQCPASVDTSGQRPTVSVKIAPTTPTHIPLSSSSSCSSCFASPLSTHEAEPSKRRDETRARGGLRGARIDKINALLTCSKSSMSCSSLTFPRSWPDWAILTRMPSICRDRSGLTSDMRETVGSYGTRCVCITHYHRQRTRLVLGCKWHLGSEDGSMKGTR